MICQFGDLGNVRDEKERNVRASLRMRKSALAAVLWGAAWLAAVVGIPGAAAHGDLEFRWMEVLVRRVDPTYREIHVLDYQSGLSGSAFQVPGSVNLNEFKVGDHVLAFVGVNNHLILQIRKVPAPTGDARYQQALHRLLAEEKGRDS